MIIEVCLFLSYSSAIGSILIPEFSEVSDKTISKIQPLGHNQEGKSYVVVHEKVAIYITLSSHCMLPPNFQIL